MKSDICKGGISLYDRYDIAIFFFGILVAI